MVEKVKTTVILKKVTTCRIDPQIDRGACGLQSMRSQKSQV